MDCWSSRRESSRHARHISWTLEDISSNISSHDDKSVQPPVSLQTIYHHVNQNSHADAQWNIRYAISAPFNGEVTLMTNRMARRNHVIGDWIGEPGIRALKSECLGVRFIIAYPSLHSEVRPQSAFAISISTLPACDKPLNILSASFSLSADTEMQRCCRPSNHVTWIP